MQIALIIIIFGLFVINLINVVIYNSWIKIMKQQHQETITLNREMFKMSKTIQSEQQEFQRTQHEHLLKAIDEGKIQIVNPS